MATYTPRWAAKFSQRAMSSACSIRIASYIGVYPGRSHARAEGGNPICAGFKNNRLMWSATTTTSPEANLGFSPPLALDRIKRCAPNARMDKTGNANSDGE